MPRLTDPPILRRIAARALVTAVVVGPLLTLINQYDAIAGPAALDLGKATLTLAVPFLVALVSGLLTARGFLAQIEAERIAADAARTALAQHLAQAGAASRSSATATPGPPSP
ncbi:MAG: hypothetical protein AAFR17_07845 [Pseudomonadota bacterium]